MIPRLSRVGLLLWSAVAVVIVVESQTLAAFVGLELSLAGMFVLWAAIVSVLTALTIRTESIDRSEPAATD